MAKRRKSTKKPGPPTSVRMKMMNKHLRDVRSGKAKSTINSGRRNTGHISTKKRKPRRIEGKNWWQKMTKEARKAYLKRHPNSKLTVGK